jgi:protoheme IX farnesyltransferase
MEELNKNKTISESRSFMLASKAKDYFMLIKFTLSFMVVFSTVISYLLVPNVSFDILQVLLLFVGGLLVTGSANAINQILEKDTDAMMKRTANRPLSSGRMSVNEGWMFVFISAVVGCGIMYSFSIEAALLSLLSLLLYGFVYTPLKKVNSIAVLMGAIPGALPCLIGWVAGFTEGQPHDWRGGWVLFLIQFLWQFPHFWAIAWVAHKDYSAAGFKLLPSDKGPTKFTALQTIMYSTMMIPVGILPYYYKISGVTSMWICLACNLFMVLLSIQLFRKMDVSAAKKVMFGSYFYLMIVFFSLYFDKIRVVEAELPAHVNLLPPYEHRNNLLVTVF